MQHRIKKRRHFRCLRFLIFLSRSAAQMVVPELYAKSKRLCILSDNLTGKDYHSKPQQEYGESEKEKSAENRLSRPGSRDEFGLFGIIISDHLPLQFPFIEKSLAIAIPIVFSIYHGLVGGKVTCLSERLIRVFTPLLPYRLVRLHQCHHRMGCVSAGYCSHNRLTHVSVGESPTTQTKSG